MKLESPVFTRAVFTPVLHAARVNVVSRLPKVFAICVCLPIVLVRCPENVLRTCVRQNTFGKSSPRESSPTPTPMPVGDFPRTLL